MTSAPQSPMRTRQPDERIVVAELDLDARDVAAAPDARGDDDGTVAPALEVAERDQQRHDGARRPAAHDDAALDPLQLALLALTVPQQRPQLLGEAPVEPAADARVGRVDDDGGGAQPRSQ